MSQEMQVLGHLKQYGSITPMTALQRYGCFRLAARIDRLKGKGHAIETELVKQGGKRFARYRLAQKTRRSGLVA